MGEGGGTPVEHRRRAVLAAGVTGLAAALTGCAARGSAGSPPASRAGSRASGGPEAFARLEERFGGRLGVFALDTGSGMTAGHRAGERFLMCSTVKCLVVAAILHRASAEPGLLERRVRYTRADLLAHAPVARQRLATGMTVGELCEAALTVSDNTAENLLTAHLGGPAATTAFVRSLGDPVTRCDRTEPALNDRAPGDERDTSTPSWFVRDLRRLAFAGPLAPGRRTALLRWMTACTTGAAQIRAGVPHGWQVADKTGSGTAGDSHDVGIVRPPGRAPVVLAVFTEPDDPHSTAGRATIAAATSAALAALGVRP